MNDASKVEVNSSNTAVNSWKPVDIRPKLNVSAPNYYVFGCNVSPMLLSVEHPSAVVGGSNSAISVSNLVVKGALGEPSPSIPKMKNSTMKEEFVENVINAENNLFASTQVKYNPSMLLQVELNTTDNSLAVAQNTPVLGSYVSTQPSEDESVRYKDVSMLTYNLPPPPPSDMKQHLSTDECFKCSICDKEFADENPLKAHMIMHAQRTKARSCDYCELVFPSKGKWYAHFKTHFNDPSFDCTFCNTSFVTQKYLEDHMKYHDAKSTDFILGDTNFSEDCHEDRIFPCTFCNKEFPDRSAILFHLRIHTSEIIFRCMYCGKMFLNKSELNLHVRIHTGDKAHLCELCNKSFLTTSNLKQHLRTHTGDKPFCCNDCHKAFSNKSNLMQHRKVHTGEKPYKCKFCEKSFTTTSNLTQHLRIHTGIKPYVCEHCGKAFINKSNLSQHKKTHRFIPTAKNDSGGKK